MRNIPHEAGDRAYRLLNECIQEVVELQAETNPAVDEVIQKCYYRVKELDLRTYLADPERIEPAFMEALGMDSEDFAAHLRLMARHSASAHREAEREMQEELAELANPTSP